MKIAVCSYRGGSGKSLFAITLASSILKDNLLIEADFLAPSLHYVVPDVEYYWNDYLLNRGKGQLINKVRGLKVVCTRPNDTDLFTQIQNREIWTNQFSDRILEFLTQQEAERDYIIIDNQAGTFFSSIVHTFFSDIIICLIRPDRADVMGTRDYLKHLNKEFYIVWNQVLDHPDMDEVIENWTTELFEEMDYYQGTLGKIKFDAEAAFQRWVEGKVFVNSTDFGKAVKQIAEQIEQISQDF